MSETEHSAYEFAKVRMVVMAAMTRRRRRDDDDDDDDDDCNGEMVMVRW